MQHGHVLGIDVSKDKLDLALLDEDGQLWHKVITNNMAGLTELSRWLKLHQVEMLHACLEATGKYGEAVAKYLHQQGYHVSVVNPACIKGYAASKLQRNKTDKIDAKLIADYCRKEQPRYWNPPPVHLEALQDLVRRLDDLQNLRVQESNRLQSGVQTDYVIADLEAHITYLDQCIVQLKQAIQDIINQHPDLRQSRDLLDSIPGIGELTAAKLLCEIRNIHEFESVEQLVAYAGLSPRNCLSGSSVRRRTRMSKTGNSHLRQALYMPAIVAKTYNPIVRSFCDRLASRGLRPMQLVAAAMKKLLHLVYGILRSGKPFDPNYLCTTQVTS